MNKKSRLQEFQRSGGRVTLLTQDDAFSGEITKIDGDEIVVVTVAKKHVGGRRSHATEHKEVGRHFLQINDISSIGINV